VNGVKTIEPGVRGGPHVELLDARALGVTESQLRDRARARSAGTGPFVSRSYRHPYALIASHTGPVGVDIERIESCDPDFARSICTPDEARAIGARPCGDRLVTSMWSGKEALAKALGEPVAYDPRRLQAPTGWPDGRAGAWRAAELAAPAGHVAWLCWRAVPAVRDAGDAPAPAPPA
jgi:phosphopantetheinyl transferase